MTLRFALAGLLAACTAMPTPAPADEWDDKLAHRDVDYSAALRIAALRLNGELPTLPEIVQVAEAPDLDAKKAAYESLLRGYVASPRFARQMFRFWQDAMKLGGTPDLDHAPALAVEIILDNRPFTDLFTATAGTCPTFDPVTSQLAPGDCQKRSPAMVGVLTDPGMNTQFFSNFGFRRVRWVQETFACKKFPAELSPTPTDVGGATPYTGTFPFDSIAGGMGVAVDFRDVSSVICANCHSNINHIAPLFAHYDASGTYADSIVVPTPLPTSPLATMQDYLPPGEGTAWRHGVPIADMTALGAAMAADPEVATCAMTRLWGWAFGKTDIVDTRDDIPASVIGPHVDAFRANGFRIKDALLDMFTSDDFIKF